MLEPSTVRLQSLYDHIDPVAKQDCASINAFFADPAPATRATTAVHASAAATCMRTADSRSRPRKLLTSEQLQSFIHTGFVSVSVLDDLGADWVASFYDRCRQHALSRSEAPLFRKLSVEVNQLLDCPVVAGGLASLLGPDYLLLPGEFANDGLKLHQARPPGSDQGFHRDGTDHGPTQSTVRDHRPAHLIPMFYPQVQSRLHQKLVVAWLTFEWAHRTTRDCCRILRSRWAQRV